MKLEHRGNCVLIKYIPDDRNEATGWFDEENGKIYISSKISLSERECVYFHELSHKECWLNKCKCWNSSYWCEYHAMRGELQKVIARNSVYLNRGYAKNVDRTFLKYQQNQKLWGKHLAAMKRLMKTKAFKLWRLGYRRKEKL